MLPIIADEDVLAFFESGPSASSSSSSTGSSLIFSLPFPFGSAVTLLTSASVLSLETLGSCMAVVHRRRMSSRAICLNSPINLGMISKRRRKNLSMKGGWCIPISLSEFNTNSNCAFWNIELILSLNSCSKADPRSPPCESCELCENININCVVMLCRVV